MDEPGKDMSLPQVAAQNPEFGSIRTGVLSPHLAHNLSNTATYRLGPKEARGKEAAEWSQPAACQR